MRPIYFGIWGRTGAIRIGIWFFGKKITRYNFTVCVGRTVGLQQRSKQRIHQNSEIIERRLRTIVNDSINCEQCTCTVSGLSEGTYVIYERGLWMLSRRCVFSYYVRERAGELVYLARVGPIVSSCQTEEHRSSQLSSYYCFYDRLPWQSTADLQINRPKYNVDRRFQNPDWHIFQIKSFRSVDLRLCMWKGERAVISTSSRWFIRLLPSVWRDRTTRARVMFHTWSVPASARGRAQSTRASGRQRAACTDNIPFFYRLYCPPSTSCVLTSHILSVPRLAAVFDAISILLVLFRFRRQRSLASPIVYM